MGGGSSQPCRIPATFFPTLPVMVCTKWVLTGVRCPEESSALSEARMKCCFYATAVLGIFKASREIKCKECALKERTM